ncbi:hypothetical protein [Pseudomonas sp. LRF_L74]|uniref:hypothetical protein n=1 Tax=Pseudomonas sp. LRF_L74 TaxID=3369422 RepID=UPI003F5E2398
MSESSAPNPYAAPASNLQELDLSKVPSIEEALNRGYDYTISDVLSESWERVKGTKGIIIGGALIYYAVMMLATFILGFIFGLIGLADESTITGIFIGQFVVSIIASACSYPLLAGVNMVGIRRAADQPVSFNEIFAHMGRFVPVLLTGLLMMVLIYIGMLLFVLPGIYLSVAYMLAIPLVVERGLSPWQALEASRKAISQHWFKAFGLFLVLGLIMAVSAIPLFIGLVWTLPMFIIGMGILYRIIFGVLPAPAA